MDADRDTRSCIESPAAVQATPPTGNKPPLHCLRPASREVVVHMPKGYALPQVGVAEAEPVAAQAEASTAPANPSCPAK